MENYTLKTKQHLRTKDIALCGLFTALIIVGSFIRIPVPVVPFTLQLLFTTLAGVLLGARLGTLSVLLYLFLGLLGVPVFTEGGGFSYIFQPTFGYLIGFAVGCWLTGTIVGSRHNPSYLRLLLANFAGMAVVYLFGVVYCYFIVNFYLVGKAMSLWNVIWYGFCLPVPGDIFLCFLTAALCKRLIPRLAKYR